MAWLGVIEYTLQPRLRQAASMSDTSSVRLVTDITTVREDGRVRRWLRRHSSRTVDTCWQPARTSGIRVTTTITGDLWRQTMYSCHGFSPITTSSCSCNWHRLPTPAPHTAITHRLVSASTFSMSCFLTHDVGMFRFRIDLHVWSSVCICNDTWWNRYSRCCYLNVWKNSTQKTTIIRLFAVHLVTLIDLCLVAVWWRAWRRQCWPRWSVQSEGHWSSRSPRQQSGSTPSQRQRTWTVTDDVHQRSVQPTTSSAAAAHTVSAGGQEEVSTLRPVQGGNTATRRRLYRLLDSTSGRYWSSTVRASDAARPSGLRRSEWCRYRQYSSTANWWLPSVLFPLTCLTWNKNGLKYLAEKLIIVTVVRITADMVQSCFNDIT